MLNLHSYISIGERIFPTMSLQHNWNSLQKHAPYEVKQHVQPFVIPKETFKLVKKKNTPVE